MPKDSEFLYDPETGKLWREAGCLDPRGYRNVHFQGKLRLEHRVIWFLHYGEWPKLPVDHINGNRSDNRIANLRLATASQNGYNRRKPRNNTSGEKGVTWVKRRNQWQAVITVNGTQKFLGRFASREAAATVYQKSALQYHGEFANLGL